MVYPENEFNSKRHNNKWGNPRERYGGFRNGPSSRYNKKTRYSYRNNRPYRGRTQRDRKPPSRPSSRPASPVFLGSEEHTKRKIAETSSIIMKHLLNPDIPLVKKPATVENENKTEDEIKGNDEKRLETNNTPKSKSKKINYNFDEIQGKILKHITKLNNGRRRNLINAKSSNFDSGIQQIQKQKRLELSRILRQMCSHEFQGNSEEADDILNSIIPDIGIKIEDLPADFIVELRNTLDFEDMDNDEHFMNNFVHNAGNISNLQNFSTTSAVETSMEIDDMKQKAMKTTTIIPTIESEQLCDKITLEPRIEFGGIIEDNDPFHDTVDDYAVTVKSESDVKPDLAECMTQNENLEMPPVINNENKDICSIPTDYTIVKQEPEDETVLVLPLKDADIVDDIPPKDNIIIKEEIDDISANAEIVMKDNIGFSFNPIIDCDGENLNDLNKTASSPLNYDIAAENTSRLNECGTQTEKLSIVNEVTALLLNSFNGRSPSTFDDCFDIMYDVDNLITELSQFRQNLFRSLNQNKSNKRKKTDEADLVKNLVNEEFNRLSKRSKKKTKKKVTKPPDNDTSISETLNTTEIEVRPELNQTKNVDTGNYKLVEFEDKNEKILFTKIRSNFLVATTESGKVLYFNLQNGHCDHCVQVTKVPVTCLNFMKEQMFVGSFDPVLMIYNIDDKRLLRTEYIEESIQCMELKWDYLFVGCMRGTLARYSLTKSKVVFSDRISDSNILVIKAAQEGARRILLIGTRNSPICIRDAMTGLHMRTLSQSSTVYSLVLERNLVYCGTTTQNIQVFSFHDGNLVQVHKAPNSKGVGCMKVFENLLFASCHNGNIYAYNINNNEFLGTMEGPGGVIISMEIIKYQVIVSTMSFQFKSIPIPTFILRNISQ